MEPNRTKDNERPVRVLGLAGSLRKGSYNRALLRAAQELAPDDMEISTFDLSEIPLYNKDLDTNEQRPEPVNRLKQTIGTADALLVATPEYNHSVPGVLKNAIDWASRPGYASVLKGKPVGLIGASPGPIGTARAQEHLKPIFEATLSFQMPHPGVLVTRAGKKFDEEGRLNHEDTRQFLADYLEAFASYAHRLRASSGDHRRKQEEEANPA